MVKDPAIYRLSPTYHLWHFLCDFCNFCMHFLHFLNFLGAFFFCAFFYVFNNEDFLFAFFFDHQGKKGDFFVSQKV
jgi:hypothetical protein